MALIPLWQTAQALLALVESTFTAEGVGLPERRYITAGAAGGTAWDCEQVVVGVLQGSALPAGGAGAGAEFAAVTPAPAGFISPPSVQFLVEVVRDHPVPDENYDGVSPPTVGEEMCAAEVSLQDAAVLHRVGVRALREGLTAPGTGQVSYAGVEPAGPQGGASAMRLRVAATLMT